MNSFNRPAYNGVLLYRLFSFLLVVVILIPGTSVFAAGSDGGKIRILPLGDSITQSETSHASYRYPLWKKMIDAGIDFDFVGSLRNQRGKGNPPQPNYKGKKFDKDHEGHFGWRTIDIIRGRGNNYKGSGTGSLRQWLKHYEADIVLMHLGTNEAFTKASNEITGKRLQVVINTLREDNPNVIIIMSTLIPTTRSPQDTKAVVALNKYIPIFAKALNTPESPVILIDQFTGFDPKTDVYDGVHPSASGEEKMAQKWFDAIMKVLEIREGK